MKKLLLIFPFVLAFSPVFASAYSINTTSSNVQQNIFKGGTTGNSNRTAQEITTTAAGTVSSLTYSLDANNGPSDSVVISIYTDSGGHPGTLVAASNPVAGSTMSDQVSGPAPVTFTFSSPVSLDASTAYWLVASRTGGRNTSQYYETGGSGSGNIAGFMWNYESISIWYSVSSGGAWDNVSLDVTVPSSGGSNSMYALTIYASSSLASMIGSSPDDVVTWMYDIIAKPILGGVLLVLRTIIPILVIIGILSILVFIGYRLWHMWRGH